MCYILRFVYEAKKYQSCTHGAATALPVPYQLTPSISLTMNKCQAAKEPVSNHLFKQIIKNINIHCAWKCLTLSAS